MTQTDRQKTKKKKVLERKRGTDSQTDRHTERQGQRLETEGANGDRADSDEERARNWEQRGLVTAGKAEWRHTRGR